MTALLAFILTIVIVVGVHEYGHYAAARRCGVRVLKFSIGFGRPILRHVGRDGTVWQLGWIPLGGFVQMLNNEQMARDLGMRLEGEPAAAEPEAEPAPEPGPEGADEGGEQREGPGEFSGGTFRVEETLDGVSYGKRAFVIFAGPLANFVLAAALFFAIALIGESGIRARIGSVVPGSEAELSGFVAGEDIVAVDGKQALLWSTVHEELFTAIGDRDVTVATATSTGVERERSLPTGSMPVSVLDGGGGVLRGVGLVPDSSYITLELERVTAGSPADAAGLRAGDFILAADGDVVYSWEELVRVIRPAHGREIELLYVRDGEEGVAYVVPDRIEEGGAVFGRIGVVPLVDRQLLGELQATERLGPVDAALAAVGRTWAAVATTTRMLGHLVSRELSTDHLSGPVGIAGFASAAAALGAVTFMKFIAHISISLGVINLAPIPILDGGHLLRYLVEVIIRRPLPDRILRVAAAFGVAILIALMAFAIYNDIT